MNATFWSLYLPVLFLLGVLVGIVSTAPSYYRRWRGRRAARVALDELRRHGMVTFDQRGRLEAAATAQDRHSRKGVQ